MIANKMEVHDKRNAIEKVGEYKMFREFIKSRIYESTY